MLSQHQIVSRHAHSHAQKSGTKRPAEKLGETADTKLPATTRSEFAHTSANYNNHHSQTLLNCVLATTPSLTLAKRYAHLNRDYREMAAPQYLATSGELLPNCRTLTPRPAQIPLVPLFASQVALMEASARDVTWIQLVWQMPTFYNLGQFHSVSLTQEQHEALSERLINKVNWNDAHANTTITDENNDVISAIRCAVTAENKAAPSQMVNSEKTHTTVSVIRAAAPVKALSMRYQLPAASSASDNPIDQRDGTTTHFVHCQVLPLTDTAVNAQPTDEKASKQITRQKQQQQKDMPFLGIPVITYELCGPYSDADPIEAQLLNAAIQQRSAR